MVGFGLHASLSIPTNRLVSSASFLVTSRIVLVVTSQTLIFSHLLRSVVYGGVFSLPFSTFSMTPVWTLHASTFSGTSTVALSQLSLSPGISGVSTQAVLTTLPATCSLMVAVMVKVFDAPCLSSGIVAFQVLFWMVPSDARRKVTPCGALSVTTAFFRSTLPVLVTVTWYGNSLPTWTVLCLTPSTFFSILMPGLAFGVSGWMVNCLTQSLLVRSPRLVVTVTRAV